MVMVKCRKCGRDARSEEFILDYDYGTMVCPNCVRDKKMHKQVHDELKQQQEKKKEEKPKPAGWDKVDDALERSYKEKMRNSVKVQKIDDENVKYTCPGCSYSFKYNLVKQSPTSCPYCGERISKFRV